MRSLEEIEKEIAETQAELENVQGTETEVYARIVGYYRAVRNWNKGKRDEFNHRKMFNVEGIDSASYTLPESVNNSVHADSQEESYTVSTVSTVPAKTTDAPQKKYDLFIRKTCPNCPPVKEFMKSLDMEGNIIDVDTDEGLSAAAEKGVFAAPTVIIYDENGIESARAHTKEELELIFEKVPQEA